jgi:hypothetical protein
MIYYKHSKENQKGDVKMKYDKGLKAGDKVIVRDDLTQSMTYGHCSVIPEMEDLKGKEIEVQTIISDMGFEALETGYGITWRVEMIEKKVYEFTKKEIKMNKTYVELLDNDDMTIVVNEHNKEVQVIISGQYAIIEINDNGRLSTTINSNKGDIK